jgi:hypothetical protein
MEENAMALAVGILLAALGAVAAFAWDPGHNSTYGVDVHGAGVILLVAGIASVILSLVMEAPWAGAGVVRRETETRVDAVGGRATRHDVARQV